MSLLRRDRHAAPWRKLASDEQQPENSCFSFSLSGYTESTSEEDIKKLHHRLSPRLVVGVSRWWQDDEEILINSSTHYVGIASAHHQREYSSPL
jgi:hypothetical protein